MTGLIRRLNEQGRSEFGGWLDAGAVGEAPKTLLDDPATSSSLPVEIPRPERTFEQRYELGAELVDLLRGLDALDLQVDAALWDWLSLHLIDQLCPPNDIGRRTVRAMASYLLDLDNHKRRNRHLVRTAWSLVQVHGRAARFMLSGPPDEHSDAAEQLTARQKFVTCKPLVAAADELFWDSEKDAPKRGFSNRRRGGTARRMEIVSRQFLLTYDLHAMEPAQILDLLPREFDRFRSESTTSRYRAGAAEPSSGPEHHPINPG